MMELQQIEEILGIETVLCPSCGGRFFSLKRVSEYWAIMCTGEEWCRGVGVFKSDGEIQWFYDYPNLEAAL